MRSWFGPTEAQGLTPADIGKIIGASCATVYRYSTNWPDEPKATQRRGCNGRVVRNLSFCEALRPDTRDDDGRRHLKH